MSFDPTQYGAVPVEDNPKSDSDPTSWGAVAVSDAPAFNPVEHGAIPVESSPSTQRPERTGNRLVGAPIPHMDILEPEATENPLKYLWHKATGSLIPEDVQKSLEVSDETASAINPILDVSGINSILKNTLSPEQYSQLAGGVDRRMERLAMSFVSPLGLASPGIGKLPVLAQKAISLGFFATMAKDLPDQFSAFINAKTFKEKVESGTDLITSTAMAATALLHGASRPAEGGATAEARLHARDAALPEHPATPSPSEPVQAPSQPKEATATTAPPVAQTQDISGQARPENTITALDAKINSLLQERRLSADETHRADLWRQAQSLEAQLAAEEAKAKAPVEQAVEVANAEPPPAPTINAQSEPSIVREEPPPSQQQGATPSPAGEVQRPSETAGESPASEVPAVEPATAPEAPTSGIKNAVTDELRKAMGFPEREAPHRIGEEAQLNEALRAIESNPKVGINLVNDFKENPRPPTTLETNILVYEMAARETEFHAALEAVNKATDDTSRASAQVRLDEARSAVQDAIVASEVVGEQSGRAFQARKKLIARQYERPIMEAEVQAAKGEPLNKEESAQVGKLAEEIKETQTQIDKAEQNAQAEQAKTYFDELLKEEGKTAQVEAKAGKTLLEKLKQGHDDALKSIRKRRGQTNIGVDPAVLYDVARIGAYHIANGATKLATFTKKVVADVGEWASEHIEEIFNAAKGIHDANKSAFKTTKTKANVSELAKADAEAGKLSHKTAYEMVRAKINEGVEGFDAVMQAATDELAKAIPGTTLRDVRTAFSEYGKATFPSKDALKQKLSEYRRLGQLAEAIADVQSGKAPKKSGPQRNKPTQDVREMMSQLKAEMDKAGIETTTPEQQLASRNQARATALRNQIEDLNKRITTGEKKVKGTTAPDSPEVVELRKQRDALKEEADRLYPEDDTARRLQTAKKAIEHRTKEVQRRIRDGDFSKPVRKEIVPDKELLDLKAKNAKAKAEFEQLKRKHELSKRDAFQKLKDRTLLLLQSARGIILGSDIGVLTRQGLFSWARPVTAIKATAESFKNAFSPASMARWEIEVQEREINGKPVAPLRKQSGLRITDTLNNPEELVIARILSRIPDFSVGGKRIKLSEAAKTLERFQTTFINAVRADLFDSAVRSGMTPEELKLRANFINSATGSSNVKYVPKAMSAILTSPRYEASRWEMLAQPIRNLGALARSGIKGELNRAALSNIRDLAGTAALVYGLFKLSELSGYKVEWNPTSSDFLKMRKGDEVWDVSAGLAPRIRDAIRMFVAMTHPSYRDNIGKTLTGMILRTINPAIKTPVEQLSVYAQRKMGSKSPSLPFSGFKSEEEKEGWITLAPLIVQGIQQSLKEGVGPTIFSTAREFVGTSVSRYPAADKKDKEKPQKHSKFSIRP